VLIEGTNARIPYYSNKKIGLFEAAAVDLSGVDVSGTTALYVTHGAVTGRQWSKVVGKKTTRQDVVGTFNPGDPHNVTSTDTTGMTAGDPVLLLGAGLAGVDMYVSVKTVTSPTAFEIYETILTNHVGAQVLAAEYLEIDVAFNTTTVALTWGCGGQLDALDVSSRMWADLLPGWTVELHDDAGTGYLVPGTVALSASGTSADGRIWIRGVGRPTMAVDDTDMDFFGVTGNLYGFSGFALGGVLKMQSFVDCENAAVKDVLVEDVIYVPGETPTNTLESILRIGTQVTDGRFTLRSCGAQWADYLVKCVGAPRQISIEGCIAYDVGRGTMKGVSVTGATAVEVFDSVFDTVLQGVDLGSSSSASSASRIERSVFNACIQYCITAGNVERCRGLVVRNCAMGAQVYQIDLPAGGGNVAADLDYNRYIDGASLSNCVMGAHDSEVFLTQEGFWDLAAMDYRLIASRRGGGFPATMPLGPTRCGVDVGLQREESVAGEKSVQVVDASVVGNDVEVTGKVLGYGADAGSFLRAVIDRSEIPPDLSPEAVAAELNALATQEARA